jgi:hypothetical protein
VKQLSTKAAPSLWANEILNCEYGVRMDTSRMIEDAGYDIETTVAWISDFYERIAAVNA